MALSNVYLAFLLMVVAKQLICCCDGLFYFSNFTNIRQNMDHIKAGIRLKVYKGWPRTEFFDISMNNLENILNFINYKQPLVFYIHGFQEHPTNESIQTIVTAYLERGNDNIVVLDWSDLAFDNYIIVASRVKEIAKIVAQGLEKLALLGIEMKSLHIIGHSLGAHIGGFIGKYSRFPISRITGLDPANPGFYQFGAEHISVTDAEFVDIIHTDGGFYGTLTPTGTIDFFSNGGVRPQPGCPLLGTLLPLLSPISLCNHWRSWRFYAESVMNDKAFLAVECPSYIDFLLGRCCRNKRVYFGYSTPRNASGTYYFKTKANFPFGQET